MTSYFAHLKHGLSFWEAVLGYVHLCRFDFNLRDLVLDSTRVKCNIIASCEYGSTQYHVECTKTAEA